MKAFHNDPKIKEFYVARLQEHHRLDQITQGLGFDSDTNRGCNVGCILHDYNHELYPSILGLPEWYAHLCDAIFEGLPKEKAPAFAMSTLTAITVGVDLEKVKWKLTISRNRKLLVLLDSNNEPYALQCKTAINNCIAYCEIMLNDPLAADAADEATRLSEAAVRSVARSADEAVDEAVWSVAWSAEAAVRSAAEEARSVAVSTALSVARSAEAAAVSTALSARPTARSAEKADAAWSTARRLHYEWEAETLIQLLTECNDKGLT